MSSPEEADVIAKLLGAGVAKNRFGEHLAVRNWFSTPESSDPSPVSLDLLSHTGNESTSRKTRAALEDPSKWLFLDTETTGLAGGTGTYAFLIGIAWWDAGGLQLEQLFMRDFTEERSVLEDLAARAAERPVLVTFNGKSFDWPLLENRFTLTRCIAPPKLAAHLDLLHPARALWKLRLGSVRLIELERQVLDARRLGWRRDDDVPSALIPHYYFDYLRGGPGAPLAAVIRHNQLDLRGLAALFGKINEMLADENVEGLDSLDLFGLSRFLRRRGATERAHSACWQALDGGLPAAIRPKASCDLALLAKRRGLHEQAAELWHELLADPLEGIPACDQLAIYYEHRAKDLVRAAELAQLGLEKLQRRQSAFPAAMRDPHLSVRGARLKQKFLNRIDRLRHQIKAGGGVPKPPLLPRIQSQEEAGEHKRQH